MRCSVAADRARDGCERQRVVDIRDYGPRLIDMTVDAGGDRRAFRLVESRGLDDVGQAHERGTEIAHQSAVLADRSEVGLVEKRELRLASRLVIPEIGRSAA